MATLGHDIFLVPAGDVFVLYAPRHGLAAEMNAGAALAVRRSLAVPAESEVVEPGLAGLIRALRAEPAARPSPRSGEFRPAQVGLLLTNRCNMRCTYCYAAAGDRPPIDMPLEMAVDALEFYAQRLRPGQPLFEVYLHGGEPFLVPSFARAVCEHARAAADRAGRALRLSASTNGAMPAKTARWVARHFAHVTLSFDGPPRFQNAQRPAPDGGATFDRVDRTARILRDEGCAFVPRSTVTRDNVRDLPEIVEFFCRDYGVKEVSVEPVTPCGRSSAALVPAPADLVEAVVLAGAAARAYGARLRTSMCMTEALMRAPCPVCYDAFVVTPDGLVSACHSVNRRGADGAEWLALGEYEAERRTFRIDTARLQRVREWGVERIPHCAACHARWRCGAGCRLVHTLQLGSRPAEEMCRVIRALTTWMLLCEMGDYARADSVRISAV